MTEKTIGKVSFRLREEQNFDWLKDEGEVFSVIDATGSGCICFGVEKDGEKLFYKIAGAKTVEAEINEDESIALLKHAVRITEDIKHPNLSAPVRTFEKNEFFVAVYKWRNGDCLFDHWNFDKYEADKSLVKPAERFRALPAEKKLKAAEIILDFMEQVHKSGYVAVDFYDGGVMYDFDTDTLALCDIDLYRKMPVINDAGEGWFGTKRLKAPEENEKGAVIDERTNILTVAAFIHDMFWDYDPENIKARYEKGRFILPEKVFSLGEKAFSVIKKATAFDREERFGSIAEFRKAFFEAVK